MKSSEWAKVVAGEKSLMKFITDRRSVLQIAARVMKPFRGFTAEAAAHELQAADYERWLMMDYLAPAAKKYQLKPFPDESMSFAPR